MSASRRTLCIVSRDPVQCRELVLTLQTVLDPDDEVEIIMDRRRTPEVFDAGPGAVDPPPLERRFRPDVDLAVRTKGFATVPASPRPRRSPDEPDVEERARFENILRFERRHASRPCREPAA